MADTDLRRYRCPDEIYDPAMAKAERMRNDGYDVDVSSVIRHRLDEFGAESDADSALRLGIIKGDAPVPLYRKPTPRSAA